jgi:TP901 family phage tail tape measure protein
MAETNANININADTSQALAAIKNLQRSLSGLYTNMSKGSAAAQAKVAGFQQNLVNSINATGQFTAKLTTVRTTTEAFTNALEKNKLSLGQYFKYGTAASKRFGKTFSTEFNTIEKVARERVKDLQTQYIKMGRDANGAMKAIAVRPTTLNMKDLGTQTAIAAQKQQIFNQLIKQGSTNLLNWGKNTQWAGRQLMVGFTIPLTIFATQAGRSFMQLEQQAIKFRRVYGDLFTTGAQTDQALADMRKLAEEFTKFGVAVEQTVGLAATVAQMGKTGADLTAQVTEATRLSVLGGMTQEQALNTTIGLTNAFGVSVEDLTNKVNFLNAAENQTILSIDDFNEAVPRAGSVVSQLGGDVEDLAFFLTAMREGGVNASQGANALKSSLGRLINPTQRARDQLADYGINILGIVNENSGNLRETILVLARELDKLDPLDKARAIETLFGKFQFARMSTLFQNIISEGSQASTILGLINSEAGDLASIAGRELARVEESAATKFTAAIERFQSALAPIGEEFLRLATPVIEWATGLLERFNELGEGGKRFVVLLLGAIGGIAPVLLMVIGLTANLVANFIKGIATISQFMGRFRGASQNLAEQTNYMNSEQIESAAIASSLNQTHQTLTQTFTLETQALTQLANAYMKAANTAKQFRGPIVTDGGRTIKAPGFMKGKMVPGYKDGVVSVPGPKGAGDIQPAMLAPGEAVIPADMAKKYGPLINAMIAGNIPGFVNGKGAAAGAFVSDISGRASTERGKVAIEKLLLRDLAMLEKAEDAVVQEFMEFVQGVANETTNMTKAVLDRALKDNQQLIEKYRDARYLQQNKEQFAHVGARTEMPVSEFAAADTLVAGRAGLKQDIDLVSRMIPEKVIKLYHGLGMDITGSLNEQMGNAGAQIQQLSADISQRGIEAYRKAVTIGGGVFDDIAPALQQLDANVQQGLQAAYDNGAQYVVDTRADLERLRQEADGTFDESLYVVFEDIQNDALRNVTVMGDELQEIFEVARNKLTELRMSFNRQDIDTLMQTPEGADFVNRKLTNADGSYRTSMSVSARSATGLGAFPGSYEAGRDTVLRGQQEFDRGAKDAGRVASPSKESYEVGQAHSDGFVQGAIENVDEARTAGDAIGEATTAGSRINMGRGRRAVRSQDGTVTVAQNNQVISKQTPAQIAHAAALAKATTSAQNFGAKAGKAATTLSNMGGKLTGVAFGLSGLVGAFSMVDGPLGDFSAKMFPAISVITGLTMSMQMLNTATLANVVSKRAEAASLAFLGARAAATGGLLTKMGGFIRGIGLAIGAALGPIGLLVAGLTVLAAGIFALFKIAENEKQKLIDMGNAAKLSADQLNSLANAGINLRTSGFATAPELATVGGRQVDPSIVQQLRSSEEFLNSWGPTIESLKDATQAQGEQMLANIAVQIKALGGTEDEVAQVIAAIQQEAERTELSLDFKAIDISSPQVRQERMAGIAERAQGYQGQISAAASRAGMGAGDVTQETMGMNLGGRAAAQTGTLLAGDISSQIVALEALRQEGTLTTAELQKEFRDLSGIIKDMESPGAQFEVFDQVLANLNLDETLGGIDDINMAMALLEQQALGLQISSNDIALFEAASADGADAETIRFANMRLDSISRTNAALAEQKRVEQEAAEAKALRDADVEAALTSIDEEIKALENQSAAYQFLMDAEFSEAEAKALAGNASYARAIAAAAEQDAINGTTEASDELLASINALREAGNLPGIEKTSLGGRSGGGGGVETSPFDEITKKLRLFNNAQVSVTEGFDDTMAAINKFMNVNGQMSRQFNGLNKQLNSLGLNENLIEMITGMDPDEYEKRKNELFVFDDQGSIIGMTAKLQSLNDALNMATIGEFIDEQNNITVSVGNQITALNRLTSAGASYEAAYRAVQNTALAAAISTAKSSAEIQAAAEAAMKAQEMMEKFEQVNEEEMRKQRIADAVKNQNKEFANQAKILNYINKNRSKLSEAQIESILSDKDLQSLVLEPSIAPGALQRALDNANKQAELELKIKKLTTSGQEEIFQDGFDKAMESFNVQENKIELEFEAKMAKEQSIIDVAEQDIAKLEFMLDDYEAGLEEIDRQEQVINDAYDKRYEALDRIADANAEITRQQQSQLDIADALSRGDIAAAARAVQEARAAAAEASVEDERARLERAQASQVAGLTSRGGLTRDQIQDRVRGIEEQIFRIEEDRLEPAQEAMRLAEIQKEADIEALEVLGKTKKEWEAISQRIDEARINNYKFVDAMKEALDIVEKLVESLGKGPVIAAPAPARAPARSSGGGGSSSKPAPAPTPPKPPQPTNRDDDPPKRVESSVQRAAKEVMSAAATLKKTQTAPAISIRQVENASAKLKSAQSRLRAAQIAAKKPASSAYLYRAMGGFVRKAYSGPPQQFAQGGLVSNFITRMASGGFSMGSDTIPAMLTPGEFVIRRPAVQGMGVKNLEKINRGENIGGSVYNYNLNVNVRSESDPNQIARSVMSSIRQIENKRIRGNRF